MADHGFTVTISGVDTAAADFEQRFYDAGCTDVTVSFCQGRVCLEVDHWTAALWAAIEDIARAGTTVKWVIIRRAHAETADTGGGR